MDRRAYLISVFEDTLAQIDEEKKEILIWEMWNHYDRMGQKRRKR